MKRGFVVLCAVLSPAVAVAGSITAPAVIGGIDASSATPGAVGLHYNPAALGGTEGFDVLIDGSVSFVRVNIETTRNGGIDPNTGAAYIPATARVTAPVPFLGLAWKPIDQLALGASFSIPFMGGGDYTSTESDDALPYEGPQRYGTVETRVLSLAITPALAVTPVKGLHLGFGLPIHLDSMSVVRASDPLGTEGVPVDQVGGEVTDPYGADVVLSGETSGTHLSWMTGVYVDAFEPVTLGVGFRSGGMLDVTGPGEVVAPEAFGGVTVPADVGLAFQLPPILYAAATVQPTDALSIGASWEWQLWNPCCGGEDGDIIISVLSEDGDAVGQEDGLGLDISPTIYSPRRLWNASNFAAWTGIQAADPVWLGLRVGYNQFAVPSYAINSANLDFSNVGVMAGARFKVAGPVELGLSYYKFILFTRTVTDSAWNLGDGNERFSPAYPYTASGDGVYSGAVDGVNFRVGLDF